LDRLVYSILDVSAEFQKTRNMDEERLGLKLALDRAVNFGMFEGAGAAITRVGLPIVKITLDQIVDISLFDSVCSNGVHRVLHSLGRSFVAEIHGVGDNAVANTDRIHAH